MGRNKKLKLTRVDEGEYGWQDEDGCHWSSPEAWFWSGVLGLCGCGHSEHFTEIAIELLKIFERGHSVGYVYEEYERELIAFWFEDKGLTEHGTSIAGSWLTDKGKNVIEVLIGCGVYHREE